MMFLVVEAGAVSPATSRSGSKGRAASNWSRPRPILPSMQRAIELRGILDAGQ